MIMIRGAAAPWLVHLWQGRRHGHGVDMSTPLLPEVVPEIDANLVGFYSGGRGVEGCRSWFGGALLALHFRTLR